MLYPSDCVIEDAGLRKLKTLSPFASRDNVLRVSGKYVPATIGKRMSVRSRTKSKQGLQAVMNLMMFILAADNETLACH